MSEVGRLLTVQEVAAACGVSVPSVWRWSREGSFPVPVRVAKRSTRWRREEVEAWLASLRPTRDAA